MFRCLTFALLNFSVLNYYYYIVIVIIIIIVVVFFCQRFASEKEGDREVQRTMLELLNQLDGFSSHSEIKVPNTPQQPVSCSDRP